MVAPIRSYRTTYDPGHGLDIYYSGPGAYYYSVYQVKHGVRGKPLGGSTGPRIVLRMAAEGLIWCAWQRHTYRCDSTQDLDEPCATTANMGAAILQNMDAEHEALNADSNVMNRRYWKNQPTVC